VLDDINTLEDLWTYTKQLHQKHFPESSLEPIMAGGKVSNPKYMFVFINPTYRNISSSSDWSGKRRPWTGTKYIWRIFKDAGHFGEDLLNEINSKNNWDVAFADKVYDHLSDRGFYFTNIVKWTGENADLPDSAKIKVFLPILLKEIEIVSPETIVTFGLLPFSALTGEKIKLGEYFDDAVEKNSLKYYTLNVGGRDHNVIPCYFPVGRGNPKRATKILSMLP